MNDLKSEKKKYLRLSQHLQQQKSGKPINRLRATVEPFSYCSTTQERGVSSTSREGGAPSSSQDGGVRSTLTLTSDDISPVTATLPNLSPLAPIKRVSPVWKTDALTVDRYPSTLSKSVLPDSISSPRMLSPVSSIHSCHMSSGGNQQGDDRQHMSSTPIHREVATRDCYRRSGLLKSSELESRILVQADVNKELKRLLVASIGSDLQHRLNQIVQDKAFTSRDLDASLQQLAENAEEIDRLSIECDIWRSKFLASRLMIDELAAWKADVSQQLRECQRALQQLLQEHLEMKRILISYNSDEMGCHAGEDTSWSSNHQDKTILDIAKEISSRSKMLMKQNSLEESMRNSSKTVKGIMATNGEILAVQVLSTRSSSPCAVYSRESLPLPLRLNKEQLSQQRRVKSKLSSSPLSCTSFQYILGTESHPIHFHCSRCIGKIYHV